MIDTPERAVEYWRANIPSAPWFDPAKEAFVVLVLNTRKRILGHKLVTVGTLDTCTVHRRGADLDSDRVILARHDFLRRRHQQPGRQRLQEAQAGRAAS